MGSANAFVRAINLHIFFASFLIAFSASIFIGLRQVLAENENGLRDALVVSAFLRPTIADAEGPSVAETVRRQDADVASVQFESKDETLRHAQQDPVLAKSLMLLKENPFPGRLIIRYDDTAWLRRAEPAQALNTIPQIGAVRWNAEARSVFRSTVEWRHWISVAGIGALVLALAWAFFGLYQFFARGLPVTFLLMAWGVGVVGGACAWGACFWALSRLGADAATIRPGHLSLLPVLTGIIVGMALNGQDKIREI